MMDTKYEKILLNTAIILLIVPFLYISLYCLVGYLEQGTDPFISIPMWEEIFKCFSVLLSYYIFKNGYLLSYLYTLFFAVNEFFIYIKLYKMTDCFDVPVEFYIGRGICILFHLFTLTIIYIFIKVSIKYKDVFYGLLGFLFSCIIHLMWNFYFGGVLFRWLNPINECMKNLF